MKLNGEDLLAGVGDKDGFFESRGNTRDFGVPQHAQVSLSKDYMTGFSDEHRLFKHSGEGAIEGA